MRDFAYENAYLQSCAALEVEAAGKLGRELTNVEVAAIRNPGTLMMQESVGMTIYYATEPTKLATSLHDAGVGFEERRVEYCKRAVPFLEEQFGRPLNDPKREAIEGSQYVSDLMQLMVDLGSGDPAQKHAVLAKFTDITHEG